jgi:hypothetical protein
MSAGLRQDVARDDARDALSALDEILLDEVNTAGSAGNP